MLGAGVVTLAILVGLVVWQGSFTTGPWIPASVQQTYAFWAISTLIFILTVTLGFMLFRTAVKLYIERQSDRPGSHLRWKLVAGAFGLTSVPVVFLVLFSVYVLNRNIEKWFSRPAQNIRLNLVEVGVSLDQEMQEKLAAQAHWMAALPVDSSSAAYAAFCRQNGIDKAIIESSPGAARVLCQANVAKTASGPLFTAAVDTPGGRLSLSARMAVDLARNQREIKQSIADYDQLAKDKNNIRKVYQLLLLLITLFILFFATWIALVMARLISVPISALLNAAERVRQGQLNYRVEVAATDELGTLVKAFNEMTEALEANGKELENRRRFTEAILESIPTGVISLTSDGRLQRVNRALRGIFAEEQVARAVHLEDLFTPDDATEIRYLMNRARRTGVAGSQLELKLDGRTRNLAVTVAALDEKRTSGFVLVLEDTSDLLRAQKAAAWHEVARRVAHEIKNPLTPIALCSERIARQLDRSSGAGAETDRILRECSATISGEVESVKALVDEFSQFSRLPAAQPIPSDLNDVVETALAVFANRLDGITVERDLAPGLPVVNIDREQFKRVIVNLVDNAAEAMRDALFKHLYVGTRPLEDDAVELVVADTGCGISRDDREKLFLPYFSTKGRGTGLGLAIVNHILSEHEATIRAEDNLPCGARFVIDITARAAAHARPNALELST